MFAVISLFLLTEPKVIPLYVHAYLMHARYVAACNSAQILHAAPRARGVAIFMRAWARGISMHIVIIQSVGVHVHVPIVSQGHDRI